MSLFLLPLFSLSEHPRHPRLGVRPVFPVGPSTPETPSGVVGSSLVHGYVTVLDEDGHGSSGGVEEVEPPFFLRRFSGPGAGDGGSTRPHQS